MSHWDAVTSYSPDTILALLSPPCIDKSLVVVVMLLQSVLDALGVGACYHALFAPSFALVEDPARASVTSDGRYESIAPVTNVLPTKRRVLLLRYIGVLAGQSWQANLTTTMSVAWCIDTLEHSWMIATMNKIV